MTAHHSAVCSTTIAAVRGAIDGTFARLDDLCTRPAADLHHRPYFLARHGSWHLTFLQLRDAGGLDSGETILN